MQLLELVHVRQLAQDSQKTLMTQMPAYIEQMMEQTIEEDPDLTPAERKEAAAQSAKAAKRAMKRFEELYAKKVDVPKAAEDISAELYEKYYTADEVKDLIAFYNTPTGQKTITIMPKLMNDAMQLQMQRVGPVVQSIMAQVTKEETKNLEQDLAQPAKKVAPTKKAAVKKRRRSRQMLSWPAATSHSPQCQSN